MLIYYFGFQLNSNCLQDWQQLFMFPRWSYIFMALTWDRACENRNQTRTRVYFSVMKGHRKR